MLDYVSGKEDQTEHENAWRDCSKNNAGHGLTEHDLIYKALHAPERDGQT